MVELRNSFRRLAAEQGDQMLGAEPLARAGDRGERFLREDRAVHKFDALHAQIAIAARFGALTKIGKKRLPPATRGFAQRNESIEPSALDALLFVRRLAFLDLLAAQPHVVEAIKRQRRSRQAVASRTPDFLIIGLDGFRQIGVRHEPHIGLVDAHSERNRRHHDKAVLLQETVLIVQSAAALSIPA